ncbi:hypothetical protein OUZ56_000484 [Daphnia magna]|uniref:Uncharacterized protein n=1 Tax=Daphnia magna TaxID=35525 RepID=A0ABR0A0K9_9CRUS|nr:hypothetical protein OUZ56_000484 [Daphnia magna]
MISIQNGMIANQWEGGLKAGIITARFIGHGYGSVLPEEQKVSETLWRIGDQAGPYRELPERSEGP